MVCFAGQGRVPVLLADAYTGEATQLHSLPIVSTHTYIQHNTPLHIFFLSHPPTHPPTHCFRARPNPPLCVHTVPTGEEALLEDEYTDEAAQLHLLPIVSTHTTHPCTILLHSLPSVHPPTHPLLPPPRVHIVPTGEEALLEDEYTEEEVLGELAPLTVLLGFLLIASGHNEEAVERLQPIIAGELPQREVAAIAANNWAVACFNTGERVGVQGRVLRVGCSGTRVWGGVVLGGCFWGSKLNWCRSGGGGNRGQQLGGHVLAARVRL